MKSRMIISSYSQMSYLLRFSRQHGGVSNINYHSNFSLGKSGKQWWEDRDGDL